MLKSRSDIARSAKPCVDAMLGLSAPSDKAANRLAERKRKDKLNGGIALITGQGNQSQTYQKEKR